MSSSATVGQRGIIAFDTYSDSTYDYSYAISPVVPTPGMTLKALQTIEQLYDFTGVANFDYRTSANMADAIFSTAAGGWSPVETATEVSIPLNNYTQIKERPIVVSPTGALNTPVSIPLQIVDIKLDVETQTEISDYWQYSQNDSSSAIPTKIGMVLSTAYLSGTVPRMQLVVKDTAGVIIGTFDTVTHIAQFKHSINGGLSFLSYAPPNTVDTRVQFTFITPPGVDIQVAWNEY